jgi:hypothetical protein
VKIKILIICVFSNVYVFGQSNINRGISIGFSAGNNLISGVLNGKNCILQNEDKIAILPNMNKNVFNLGVCLSFIVQDGPIGGIYANIINSKCEIKNKIQNIRDITCGIYWAKLSFWPTKETKLKHLQSYPIIGASTIITKISNSYYGYGYSNKYNFTDSKLSLNGYSFDCGFGFLYFPFESIHLRTQIVFSRGSLVVGEMESQKNLAYNRINISMILSYTI